MKLWEAASKVKVGLAVETDDRKVLQQQLYRARAELGGYDDIVIVVPATEGELWLVHRGADETG